MIEYIDGKPTPHAEETLHELGTSPAFVGERMVCLICGATEISDPQRESDWRAIEADGDRYYFCPQEFPRDGTSDAFGLAYQRCLAFVVAAKNPHIAPPADLETLRRPVDWKTGKVK